METIEISEERSVLLDSAHNQESIVLLRQHVEALSKSGCRFNVLFGALRDKAAAGMLQTISEGAQSVVVVAPQSDRAIAAEELAGFASGAIAEVSCQRALDRALALDCDLTLVCGSILSRRRSANGIETPLRRSRTCGDRSDRALGASQLASLSTRPLMSATLEPRFEEACNGLLCEPSPHDSRADGQDVGVVVRSRHRS